MNILTPGRNIVLIGLMGSGKTTVGRILAVRLQREFYDTDEMVERETGQTVSEIFAVEGQRRFRALESEAIRAVAALRGRVIAVGGGAVTVPANVTHLRATGDLVWLDADPAELAARCAAEGVELRPLLAGGDPAERIAALRTARHADYVAAAAHRIDTGGMTPEEVADAVLEWARHQPGLLTREEREA